MIYIKILFTGFSPFGLEKINPSWEAVKILPDNIKDIEIIKIMIPTVFEKSINNVDQAIQKYDPDVVISVGQAGGRFGINPERIAININDASICDNDGNQPIDTPVFKDGPTAYFTTLPIKSIVKDILKNNIFSSVSNTAGTFVCNHIMYGVLHLIATKYTHKTIRAGFIHVPFIPEQAISKVNQPYLELEKITEALRIAAISCYENKVDIKLIGGSVD